MRTSNPALSDKVFNTSMSGSRTRSRTDRMTIGGSVNKTFILLVIVMGSALWSWFNAGPGAGYEEGLAYSIPVWYWPALIGGFVTALVIIFKPNWAPVLAPVYALLQGFVVGLISVLTENRFPGIAIQAALLTFGVLFSLLLLYQSRIIKVTENFKMGIIAATGGVFFIYMLGFVLSFFGKSIPLIHGNGTFGILFSLAVVCIAAMNLVLDFDFIEKGAERGAPKYMEWYAAFGLLVTLIWLYLEILRLLSKTRSRN